jgi:MFS family permease
MHKDIFEVGRAEGTLVGSMGVASFLFLSPFMGKLADIIPPKICILFGGSLMTMGYVAASFAETIGYLCLTHGVMMGSGASVLYVTSASCVSHWFDAKRGLATGIAVSGAGFGNVVLPPLIEAAIDKYSWRTALRLMALVSCSATTVAFFLLERRLPLLQRGSKQSLCQFLSLDLSLLKNKSVFLLMATFGVYQLGFFIPLHHLPLYAEDHGVSQKGAALVVTFLGLGNLFGRFFVGVLCDKIGSVRTGLFCTFAAAISTAFWPLCTTLPTISTYAFFYGLAACAFWGIVPLVCGQAVPMERLGSALGLVVGPAMVPGVVAGPALAGLFHDSTGSYIVPIYFTVAVMLVASGIYSKVPLAPEQETTRKWEVGLQLSVGRSPGDRASSSAREMGDTEDDTSPSPPPSHEKIHVSLLMGEDHSSSF